MRTKMLRITLFVIFSALCVFSRPARANDGDWVEGPVRWWWIYVTPADLRPHQADVIKMDVVQVRSDRTGYNEYRVVFTLMNRSSYRYNGGNPYQMDFHYGEEPQPEWGTIARGILPSLAPGQSTQVSGLAYTPGTGTYNKFVSLAVSPQPEPPKTN